MYDIVIVGLGPAGATLARCLHSGLRVLALDQKSAAPEADSWQKPCGGLLAPDAQKALSRFGLTLPLDILVDPQIFSVRTIDLASGLTRHYQRHYINLDRHRLDLWLKSLLPSHVEVRHNARCREVQKQDDGTFTVTYLEDGARKTVHTHAVVGADGANSVVRRSLFPGKKMRSYLSIQQWFPDRHPTPFYSCIFDPASTDSYSWGLTKGDYFIFGGAFPAKGGRAAFHALKEKLRPYGFQLDNPVKTEACLVLRPTGPHSFLCGGGGAYFVGEAAGFISPSSLEGISHALGSGWQLACCLNKDPRNAGPAYRAATRRIRLKLVGKNLKSPFMYQPLLRKLVMKSGLSSIHVAGPHGEKTPQP